MPQASEELREIIRNRFGDILDGPPLEFLEEKGWKENKGILSNSNYTNLKAIPQAEWECIIFMIHEWDYDLDKSGFK